MFAQALFALSCRFSRRSLSIVTVAGLVLAMLAAVVSTAPSARADTSPPAGTTDTVTADALPTVQVDGVVWSQVTVGNTVYATGSFGYARPAGTPVGDSSQVVRTNLLAYDITTGNLITSFNHSLNAQGQTITASPDGSTVYVGGDFTIVDNQTRQHVAAFSTATGALVSTFRPNVPSQVLAIAATNSTVYVGGNFVTAGGQNRNRLAAFQAGTGALLSWAPSADDNLVTALLVSPDGSKVIVGGKFTTLNGVSRRGIGAVDPFTGANATWNAAFPLFDNGNDAGFTSLTTDGTSLYGSGYNFGSNGGAGNFEGRFSSDFDGNLRWLDSCHGDSYSTFIQGGALYSASHAHDCSDAGGWEDTNPRTWHRAQAETIAPSGKGLLPNNNGGYTNFAGLPANTLLHWYPTLTAGTFTGQGQAAWSVTGNSSYLSFGGEFPKINGVAQQGLVRFAVKSIAPNKSAPIYTTAMNPKVVSFTSGTARVSWGSTWDMDNELLTYKVYRDGGATPIYSVDQRSNFWTLPTLTFFDTGLPPGSVHSYRIRAFDPYGNSVLSPAPTSVTVSSTGTPGGTYSQGVYAAGATDYWRLGETSGTTALDYAGGNDITTAAGVTRNTAGALLTDTDPSSTFSGASTGTAGSTATAQTSSTLTVQAWVKASSSGFSGGKIVGFGSAGTGASATSDYNLYFDTAGHLLFGVTALTVPKAVASPAVYTDNNWHQVTGTVGADGLTLYVDGRRVARNAAVTTAATSSGFWRLGGDSLNNWPSKPSSAYVKSAIDEVAVYPSALTLAQIQQQYRDSGRPLSGSTAPSDAYGAAVYGSGPDLYWRLDDASGPATDASPNGVNGTFAGSGISFRTPSPVSPGTGTAVTFPGANNATLASPLQATPTTYSEELWFKTTTTRGGKLIGFGSSSSGNSGSYDRQVYMLNSGQLSFGAYTGVTNVATTPSAYNNGLWHHVVATQGAAGMVLYVDGFAVATNAQTGNQAFNGYWRVGGDNLNSWPAAPSSAYFNGTIDEVAVYSSALSASQVLAHYQASPAAVNRPPTASFTSNCPSTYCTLDGTGSTDPDGTVVGWTWDFGDGTSGTGAQVSHTYATPGDRTVTLTVTDNSGGTAVATRTVTPIQVVNQPPTAAFTPTCTDLGCSFDSTASSDPDGTITARSWNFGDGTSDTAVSPTHAYAVAGDYPVTLTVTDNSGAQTSTTVTVSPTVPANPNTAPFATDAFGRTTTTGWGTADTGGAWTTSGTTAVTPGTATWSLAAGGTGNAYLGTISRTDSDLTATVTTDKAITGGGTYVYAVGRRSGTNYEYRAAVHLYSTGKVAVALTRLSGTSTETVIKAETTVAGLTYTPGTQLDIRFQVTGTSPTSLKAKVWTHGTTEPSGWLAEATDTTDGLQVAGAVGLRSYQSGSATNAPMSVRVSAFTAGPSNTPPTAAFTPTCTALTCTVDASASTDPQGNIGSYTWSFGDGATATGATASHDYAVGGTYRITLTVTDAAGLTSVTRSTVTVA